MTVDGDTPSTEPTITKIRVTISPTETWAYTTPDNNLASAELVEGDPKIVRTKMQTVETSESNLQTINRKLRGISSQEKIRSTVVAPRSPTA